MLAGKKRGAFVETHPRNNRDFFILLFSLVFGALGILFLKFGLFPIEVYFLRNYGLLPSIWAIFTLLAYALIVYIGGSSQIEPEVIGDNCYYLGFLFTLVSLAATLFQVIETNANVSLIRNIVSGFGIALSSTIVGIGLRVLFFQHRTDLVARDKENQKDVQKAIKEFRLALSESTTKLKQFAIESIQKASERDEHIRTSIDKTLNAQVSNVSKLTVELEKVIERLSTSLPESRESFDNKIIEMTSQSLNKIIEMTSQSLNKLVEEIRIFQNQNTTHVFKELEKAVNSFKLTLERLNKEKNEIQTSLNQNTTHVFKELEKAVNSFKLTLEGLNKEKNEIQTSLNQNTTSVTKELQQAAKSLKIALDEINRTNIFGNNLSELNTILRQFKEASSTKHSSTMQTNGRSPASMNPTGFDTVDTHSNEQEGFFRRLDRMWRG